MSCCNVSVARYTETIVMITPHVVTDPREAEAFSAEQSRRVQRNDQLIREHRQEFEGAPLEE